MLFYFSFSYRFAVIVAKWNRASFFLLGCCFQNSTPILLNHCHRRNKFQRPLGARFGNTSADEPLSENWNLCFQNAFNTSWLTGGLKLEPPSLFSRFSPKTENLEREKGWCNYQDTNLKKHIGNIGMHLHKYKNKKLAFIQSCFCFLTGNNDC